MFQSALSSGGTFFVYVVALLGAAVVALCFANWRSNTHGQ